jgi:nuclear GTP-binding protein
MGTGKKEANRKVRQGKIGDGMANVRTKGENFYRYALCALFGVKKDVLLT